METNIGLNEEQRKMISEGLSHFLADSYTLYLKTQNFHWNVTGPHFGSLHLVFEGQYEDLADAVDAIAERIRALGFAAPASFSQFQQLASIKEETNVPSSEDMIKTLLEDHESIIRSARSLCAKAADINDETTADLLTGRLGVHEKTAWMLRSTL